MRKLFLVLLALAFLMPVRGMAVERTVLAELQTATW